MISEEEKAELTHQVYCKTGAAIQVWISTVNSLEICICILMKKKTFSPENDSVPDVMSFSDGKKIRVFRTEFLDEKNDKYRLLLNIDRSVNVLIKGLNSRNYFAHTLFPIDENGNINPRNKGSQDLFIVDKKGNITLRTKGSPEVIEYNPPSVKIAFLENRRQDVLNAYELLDDFASKMFSQLKKDQIKNKKEKINHEQITH